MIYNKRLRLLKENGVGDFEELGFVSAYFRSMTTYQIFQAKANHIDASLEVHARFRELVFEATHLEFKGTKFRIESMDNVNMQSREIKILCSEVS